MLGFGLSLLFVPLLASLVSSSCFTNPPFQRFQLGKFNITVVSDGILEAMDNPFSANDEAVRRSYRASFRSTEPFVVSINVVIIDTPANRIMVDSGAFNIPEFPGFGTGGLLMQNLKAAGIPAESIDAIVFTHAHPDHVSGIRTLQGERAFPNAKLYVSKKEHEFWTTVPIVNTRPESLPDGFFLGGQAVYLRSIAPYGNDIELVPENGMPLPGIKLIPAPGHSPAHVAVRAISQGKRLFITGDIWITKADQLENPDWVFFSDANDTQAFSSRITVLSSVARSRDLVLGYHEAFPGIGYVSINGAAFSWTPAPLQLLGVGTSTVCASS